MEKSRGKIDCAICGMKHTKKWLVGHPYHWMKLGVINGSKYPTAPEYTFPKD